jgi:hypothetical protein
MSHIPEWGTNMSTSNSSESKQVTREQIEVRAYEIYLQRAGSDGSDIDDWLRAEQELLAGRDTAAADAGPLPLDYATSDANPESEHHRLRERHAAAGDPS